MQRQIQVAALLVLASGVAAAESRVEKPEYVVAIAGPAETGAGRPAAFAVMVAARGTFHLNDEYPSNFKVAASPGGLKYSRDKVERGSGIVLEPCGAGAHACSARLLVPFVAETAGSHTVGGTLAFSVCDDERCLIEKVAVSFPVATK